jgi:hydroxymethylpyrimidine/phosphomethylpyrimidine kinase
MPRKKTETPSVQPRTKTAAEQRPCALTIAGSDSGGGAGIQADLKTFAALGVHGASAITCITAQNPREVRSIQAIRPAMVRDQIEAVVSELKPAALKTGMLYSREIIRTVAGAVRALKAPLVVDPVMIATSGAVLLKPNAIRAMLDDLFPLATVVTPNIDEARHILSANIESLEEARAAARELHYRFGCAALVKGGHLKDMPSAVDFFFDGETELMLEAPFVRGMSSHGTGCTYSAAMAAHLALGLDLPAVTAAAKETISNAIAGSFRCAKHWVLHPGPDRHTRHAQGILAPLGAGVERTIQTEQR